MFYLSLTWQFIIRVCEVWGVQVIILFVSIMAITKITKDPRWLKKSFNLFYKYMVGEI